MVLTDIEKIKRNDQFIDVSLMNGSSTKVLLWPCVPSSEILGKSVSEKRETLKKENVTPINYRACIESIHVKIKFFGKN